MAGLVTICCSGLIAVTLNSIRIACWKW